MSPDPVCQNCKYFTPDRIVEPGEVTAAVTCRAFPNGIPDRFLVSKHTKVVSEQVGEYVFSPTQDS